MTEQQLADLRRITSEGFACVPHGGIADAWYRELEELGYLQATEFPLAVRFDVTDKGKQALHQAAQGTLNVGRCEKTCSEVQYLLKFVETLEWSFEIWSDLGRFQEMGCPSCKKSENQGHAVGCKLAAELSRWKETK